MTTDQQAFLTVLSFVLMVVGFVGVFSVVFDWLEDHAWFSRAFTAGLGSLSLRRILIYAAIFLVCRVVAYVVTLWWRGQL